MVKEFLKFCQYGRNLSPITMTNYERILQLFTNFLLGKGKTLQSVVENDVTDFVAECLKNGSKASSVNVYVCTLRAFYKWAVMFHYDTFKVNPAAGVPKLKVRKDLPVCISEKKMQKILDNLGETSWKEQRVKLAILMGYHTGLRRNEMVILKCDDLDLEEKTIRVLGKGGKVRVVPMSGQLCQLVEKYFATRKLLGLTSPWLFVKSTNKPLGYFDFAHIVKAALRQFVPEDMAHCHILRHSFATTCLNSGVSIENIAAIMGHSSIETTMRYLTISSARIKSQLEGVF